METASGGRIHRILGPVLTGAVNRRANDLPRGVADFPTAFTAFHQAYAARKGAVIWGDKSPVYYDSLPALARLFPQARFIIQWRDPAATANAIARAAPSAPWYQRRGIYLRGLIGYQVLKSGVDFLLSRGQPVCQLTYEELTSDTAKVMREVCRFLEIPYRDELADLRGADRSAIFKEAHHSLVRGDNIISKPRTVILDQAIRQKINGYVKLWKRRYNNEWPPSVLTDADDVAMPRLPQRVGDQVAYRAVYRTELLGRAIDDRVKWWGPDRHIVTYKINPRRDELYFIASTPEPEFRIESWSAMGSLDQLREARWRTAELASVVDVEDGGRAHAGHSGTPDGRGGGTMRR